MAHPPHAARLLISILLVTAAAAAKARQPQDPYPFSEELRVLAEDVASDDYRKLVDEMLITDLLAEWQRVETPDSSARFLQQHGGRDRVLSDPTLRTAYEQRQAVEQQFLEIMRKGFARHGVRPPFDEGARARPAGTTSGTGPAERPLLSVVLPAPGAADHWPRFRGPDGQGIARTRGLPLHWSRSENVVWRTPLPPGNSSPIIWGERIFLTSAAADGSRRSVHCLRRRDGELLWTALCPPHEAEPMVRDKNGYASATPVTDGERVITYFGSGGLLALDFEGRQLWHYPLPGFDSTWGSGSSPLLYEDSLIMIHDQNRADSLFLCLDKRTGVLRWQRPRARAMGWSTPVVVRVAGHDELLFAGGETVKGYDPRTGEELWTLTGPTHEVIPTLVVGRDLVYSASGRLGPTLALVPGGRGDVTATHLVWQTTRGGPHVPSPILYEDRLYTVNDTGIATALDAHSGEVVWQQRIRDRFSASPIAAEGLLYCCSESGTTYVLRAGDVFKLVAQNELEEPILASPAALAGRLYIRTSEALYCLGTGTER
jgi:hypothetical protein